ncbi:MAG: hypothetical protein ING69_12845 [Rhodocyclaceae bacterium]|nr:hypothetical protein [Rhodocyclaceae bacterium]MCA3083531.1 hypothetical protein [Rhodocyclaceae bacterium]
MNQVFAPIQKQVPNSTSSAEINQSDAGDIVSLFSFDETLRHMLPRRIETAQVERLTGSEASSNFYEDGAYVPANAWAPISEKEAAMYLSDASRFDPLTNVGIAEIDRHLVRRILPDLLSQDNLDPFWSYDIPTAKRQELTSFICGKFSALEAPFIHGISAKPPGLRSTSSNPEKGQFVGMHIDSWDGSTLTERLASRVRVNVNLGPDPRYFLYVPITIAGICKQLQVGGNNDEGLARPERGVFRRNNSQRVVRLMVLPGEAYVASTDCVIHDGSTSGAKSKVFTFDLRAHFAF